MDLKEIFSGLDTRIKIFAVLGLLILTGFVATNFPSDTTSYSGAGAEADHGATKSLSMDRPAPDTTDGERGEESSGTESSDRKVITTVRTTIKVSNVDIAMEGIESQVQAMDGYVESSTISSDTENTGRLTVAVPADKLGAFENNLESSYEIKSRDVDRRDVTDSYNELETEIESLQTEHQRLKELINQTDDVDTLIRLQERLSEVRSQINYKQQRLDRLDEDITYSKVYITLEGPQSFESKFELRDTLSNAYGAFFESIKLIIVGAAYLVPFLLVYGLYRLIKRFKRERL